MNGGKNTGNFFLENEKRWKWKSDDDKDGKTDEVRGGEGEEEGRQREKIRAGGIHCQGHSSHSFRGSTLVLSDHSLRRSAQCAASASRLRVGFSREGKNLNRRSDEWSVRRDYFLTRGLREKKENFAKKFIWICSAKKRKRTLGWNSENGAKWYRRECRRRNFRTFQIRCQ